MEVRLHDLEICNGRGRGLQLYGKGGIAADGLCRLLVLQQLAGLSSPPDVPIALCFHQRCPRRGRLVSGTRNQRASEQTLVAPSPVSFGLILSWEGPHVRYRQPAHVALLVFAQGERPPKAGEQERSPDLGAGEPSEHHLNLQVGSGKEQETVAKFCYKERKMGTEETKAVLGSFG